MDGFSGVQTMWGSLVHRLCLKHHPCNQVLWRKKEAGMARGRNQDIILILQQSHWTLWEAVEPHRSHAAPCWKEVAKPINSASIIHWIWADQNGFGLRWVGSLSSWQKPERPVAECYLPAALPIIRETCPSLKGALGIREPIKDGVKGRSVWTMHLQAWLGREGERAVTRRCRLEGCFLLVTLLNFFVCLAVHHVFSGIPWWLRQ